MVAIVVCIGGCVNWVVFLGGVCAGDIMVDILDVCMGLVLGCFMVPDEAVDGGCEACRSC